MQPKTQILPGILNIGYVKASSLVKGVPLHGICGSKVPVFDRVTWLDFHGETDCRCRSEKIDGGRRDMATLKFHSPTLIPYLEKLAFVVCDLNGRTWLIGSKEPPLPVITVECVSGTPGSESAGYAYDITHTAVKSLVACEVI